ncbi:MAG: BACON domain-containing protein [Tidjanibacter sp.]|nr:BACON domain-containing protein [Tidjanibacter sp.]
MKKLFYLAAAAAFALASCEPAPEGPTEVTFPDAPEKVEEYITANPAGNNGEEVLTFDIEAEGNWTIIPAEEYDWIVVAPESGKGTTTVSFEVAANETAKDRMAEYVVKESFVGSDKTSTKEYTTYNLYISQSKPESNLADGTYAFLKQLIDGKMLGDATPTVDNLYNFATEIPGIALVGVDGGKYEIQYIDFTGSTQLCDFPTEMVLPELLEMRINECMGLEGKEMPKVWDTPKLVFCNIAACGLTGEFPKGIAASKKLMTLYANNNHFYGVYPHEWASDNLQCLICCNINNHGTEVTEPFKTNDSAGMGYLVPAQMDVILNKYGDDGNHCNESRDLTQMKIGGAMDGNYIGFEAGWGQTRYETFDPYAIAGDIYVWSFHRLLVDEQPKSFFSNMGYYECYMPIPQQMMTWDQAAADEWTAYAKATYGNN